MVHSTGGEAVPAVVAGRCLTTTANSNLRHHDSGHFLF